MLKNPKYVYGRCDVDVPMKINFGEFVLNKFLAHRNKVAIINENTNTSVTYGELCQKAVNFAVSLTRLGVRKGEVVAICSENRLDVWSALVGTVCAGAVMTPLSMMYAEGEQNHALNISQPAYIVSSPSAYKTYENSFRSHKFVKDIIVFGEEKLPNTVSFEELIKDDVKIEEFEVPEVKGQTDTLFILYSSGTTGLPKGVMLTHLNVIVTMLLPVLQEDPEFITPAAISVAPWFHVMGLMFFLNYLVQGLKVVSLDRFILQLYMKTVEKYKPTTLLVVPPMLIALTKSDDNYDLSSVKFMMCGAAPLSPHILPAVKTRFPSLIAIIQGYGMTENSLIISKDYNGGRSVKPGSVGPVGSGSVVKITDILTKEPLGARQKGEICIKSVTMMKGYIGKDMKDDFDDEGFFRTGDVGYYDEDGYLYVVDRLKELIKYKGYQVPPAEIEAVLLQHPRVRDVGVVGVPDEAKGELPLAFIVLQPGRKISEEELIQFVADRLSHPKHLRGGVRFVDEIPKNPSGKILRKELKELVNNEKNRVQRL